MNRTVAYQETSNNYMDVRQKINGTQISTIKNFGVAPPAGGGDFVGQFGISADASGESLLYTYGVGGLWQLVGQSGIANNMPDTVVQEQLANDFTNADQRILDANIVYLDSGARDPNAVAIKGVGHMYVYTSNPVQVFISYDGHTWTPIITESVGDVELDKPNNFTNPTQQIQGAQITTILKGSLPPDATVIEPEREGEFYVQIAEGTTDRKARLWVSTNSGGWKWEALTHVFEIPNTVVQTSKLNNFESTGQTIAGKQIMSFVDGGDKTPEQSKIPADYDGQFYIAVHERVAGTKDVGIWVAEGNQWLPISQDFDLGTIVRSNKSNVFTVPEQILGEGGGNARHLIGARTKFSGSSPAADGNWRVQNVGEITIYENNTVVPREYSIWMGVAKNSNSDSNAGEWAMVWSSKQGAVTDYARTDISNDFVPFQYINSGSKRHMINTGHEGGAGSPKSSLVPVAPGDTYTQSYSHPSLGETRNIWIAAIEGDTQSWKRILSEDDKDVVLTTRKNNFLTHDNFLGSDSDTKRSRIVGARINHQGGTAKGVMPTQFGEILVCEEWDPTYPSDESKKIVVTYISVALNREGWMEIGRDLKTNLDYNGQDSNN